MSFILKKTSALLLVALIAALSGCSQRKDDDIAAVQWRLVSWPILSLHPSEVAITARFDGTTMSGSGGVNNYSGSYRMGPGDAFSAGPMASTKMAGPEYDMQAEAAYFKLLGEARFYALSSSKLILYDQDENESLVFEPSRP